MRLLQKALTFDDVLLLYPRVFFTHIENRSSRSFKKDFIFVEKLLCYGLDIKAVFDLLNCGSVSAAYPFNKPRLCSMGLFGFPYQKGLPAGWRDLIDYLLESSFLVLR